MSLAGKASTISFKGVVSLLLCATDGVAERSPASGLSSRKLSFVTPTRVEAQVISFVSVFLLLWFCWLTFVVCPDLSGRIAERRGRSIRLWWWMGLIFGPIAPLVVAVLPPAPMSGLRRDHPHSTAADRGAGHMSEPLAAVASLIASIWCSYRRFLRFRRGISPLAQRFNASDVWPTSITL
jgi:hypothetical protein